VTEPTDIVSAAQRREAFRRFSKKRQVQSQRSVVDEVPLGQIYHLFSPSQLVDCISYGGSLLKRVMLALCLIT
jgi:hypothetical protein